MALKTEYELGPLKVNLRVLLEPKGVIRIITMIIALLAFSTTAGFNSSDSSNNVECVGGDGMMRRATITFDYPYSGDDFDVSYEPQDEFIANTSSCRDDFDSETFSTSAEFFVGMGVLTFIYMVVAVIIYMIFITPDLTLAKYLVIGDVFASLVFAMLYLIADIAWSVGAAQLADFTEDELESRGIRCLGCNTTATRNGLDTQTFAQPAISLIFGWLAAFLWFSSLWFVYKDTVWHKDRNGPLYPLYYQQDLKKQRQKQGKEGQEPTQATPRQAAEGGAAPSQQEKGEPSEEDPTAL